MSPNLVAIFLVIQNNKVTMQEMHTLYIFLNLTSVCSKVVFRRIKIFKCLFKFFELLENLIMCPQAP